MKEIKKVFRMSTIRDLDKQLEFGDISISRRCEMLNDLAYFRYNIDGKYPVLDDSQVTDKEAIDYIRELRIWDRRNYKNPIDRALFRPNPPNYKSNEK